MIRRQGTASRHVLAALKKETGPGRVVRPTSLEPDESSANEGRCRDEENRGDSTIGRDEQLSSQSLPGHDPQSEAGIIHGVLSCDSPRKILLRAGHESIRCNRSESRLKGQGRE
jgi:hypothetical protein